jgi:hypothetical protein
MSNIRFNMLGGLPVAETFNLGIIATVLAEVSFLERLEN